jgi:hypothetical protein
MEQSEIERLLLVSFVVGLLVSCRGDPGLERGDPADRRPLFPGVASLTKQLNPMELLNCLFSPTLRLLSPSG